MLYLDVSFLFFSHICICVWKFYINFDNRENVSKLKNSHIYFVSLFSSITSSIHSCNAKPGRRLTAEKHYLRYGSRFVRTYLSIRGVYSIMPEQSAVAGWVDYTNTRKVPREETEKEGKREWGGERPWLATGNVEERGLPLSDEIGRGWGKSAMLKGWDGGERWFTEKKRRRTVASSTEARTRRAIAVRPPTTTTAASFDEESVSTILLTAEFFSHRRRLR